MKLSAFLFPQQRFHFLSIKYKQLITTVCTQNQKLFPRDMFSFYWKLPYSENHATAAETKPPQIACKNTALCDWRFVSRRWLSLKNGTTFCKVNSTNIEKSHKNHEKEFTEKTADGILYSPELSWGLVSFESYIMHPLARHHSSLFIH